MNELAVPHAFFVVGVLFPICVLASQSNIAPAANTGALAQQQRPASTVTITGTVHTPQSVVVPGAAVHLLEVTSGRAWDTSTDEEGKFTARDLPLGHYRIEARQLGLGSAFWDNDIHSSFAGTLSTQISLTLQRSAPAVTATKGLPSNAAKSANNTKNAINPSSNNRSQKADVAASQSGS